MGLRIQQLCESDVDTTEEHSLHGPSAQSYFPHGVEIQVLFLVALGLIRKLKQCVVRLIEQFAQANLQVLPSFVSQLMHSRRQASYRNHRRPLRFGLEWYDIFMSGGGIFTHVRSL